MKTKDKPNYELIHSEVELFGSDKVAELYHRHYFQDGVKIIEYYTIDDGGFVKFWKATKDPDKLNDDERHRVLGYILSSFDDDEIVNYTDLFLQGEFIEEVKP